MTETTLHNDIAERNRQGTIALVDFLEDHGMDPRELIELITDPLQCNYEDPAPLLDLYFVGFYRGWVAK